MLNHLAINFVELFRVAVKLLLRKTLWLLHTNIIVILQHTLKELKGFFVFDSKFEIIRIENLFLEKCSVFGTYL